MRDLSFNFSHSQEAKVFSVFMQNQRFAESYNIAYLNSLFIF